jgi:hypothetical protein
MQEKMTRTLRLPVNESEYQDLLKKMNGEKFTRYARRKLELNIPHIGVRDGNQNAKKKS